MTLSHTEPRCSETTAALGVHIGPVLVHAIQPGDKRDMIPNLSQWFQRWSPLDRLIARLVQVWLIPFAAQKTTKLGHFSLRFARKNERLTTPMGT